MVRSTVHATPLQKWGFSKPTFKPEEFENAGFRFRVNEKHFVNGAFQNRWRHDNHVIPLAEFSSNTNSK